MRLTELLSEDLILPSLKGTSVTSVLREFADAICAAGKHSDPDILYRRLYEREKQESTGIGKGIAIPHCKVDGLAEVVLAVGYSDGGVDFRSLDGQPTRFFFLVVSPADASVQHLRVLAALSKLLRSKNFLFKLDERPGKKELLELIKQEEGAVVTP